MELQEGEYVNEHYHLYIEFFDDGHYKKDVYCCPRYALITQIMGQYSDVDVSNMRLRKVFNHSKQCEKMIAA
jgi:hypothetical protein